MTEDIFDELYEGIEKGIIYGARILRGMFEAISNETYEIKLISIDEKIGLTEVLINRILGRKINVNKMDVWLYPKRKLRFQSLSPIIYTLMLEEIEKDKAKFSIYKSRLPKELGEEYKEELIESFTLQPGESYSFVSK